MKEIVLRPIGIIHSPFKERRGTPISPSTGRDVEGRIEVLPEYAEGLANLDGFSHIVVVFALHLSKGYDLKVKPFLDDVKKGVFATRAPARPNPIGISIVRLDRIEGNVLHIRDIDIVDGSPLLDIKPHVPAFHEEDEIRIGWLESKRDRIPDAKDDGRFIK